MATDDEPEEERTPTDGRSSRRNGVSGTLMEKILDRDERRDTNVLDALQAESRQKTWIIGGLLILLGMMFAGVLGVGVTGKIPGVGSLAIMGDEEATAWEEVVEEREREKAPPRE